MEASSTGFIGCKFNSSMNFIPSFDGCTTNVYIFFLRSFLPCRTIAEGLSPKSFFSVTSTRLATALFPVENSSPLLPYIPVTNEPPILKSESSSALRDFLSSRTKCASSFFTFSVNDINLSSANIPLKVRVLYLNLKDFLC